ncbi:uncharacterized protein LOC119013056 [Acanthopagrus latus]|uniref:uncharacterized protein LOC119013056 n=1 Tax=Acanthopagrus latus TaxID=8177 RepID=UPI00187C3708|nr:uncharacterized protein LOC119013056 [Acanthopagrus latus]
MEGSHQMFSDVASFLACDGSECVFCQKKELANKNHLCKKHLADAMYFVENNQEKFVVACFCKDKTQASRSHYHCPYCNFKTFSRPCYFMKHLKVMHGIASSKKRDKTKALKRKADNVTEDPADNLDSKPEKVSCPHCTSELSSQKNLKRHIRDVHCLDIAPMIFIDVRNGIYVTPKYDHSPVLPVHVIKSTNPPKIDCEVPNCRKFMQIAWSSGNPGKECKHLERTKNAKSYAKPAVLTSASLKDMLSKGLMSSEWGVRCENLNLDSNKLGLDSVFPVIFEDEGYSKRWVFFSVFTSQTDNWCQFGRTIVMFDTVAGQWNCQCRGTGTSHRCIHRMMAMWWIFQESPGTLMETLDIQTQDIDDLESHIVETSISCEQQPVNSQKICIMTDYLMTHKRIPFLQDLPVELRTKEQQPPPPCFVPTENTCPYCPGPTPPALNPSNTVTTQAVVYGINYVQKGVSVAVKQCPACTNVVRFQEYTSGFHNFNNRVLLTLPLCELLLSGLANKTTSGRMLDTMSLLNDNRYHHQTVKKAFHHFLSLTNFKFQFSCYQCGHHPAVVVADANWKLAFDIPFGTFKRPDPETVSEEDFEVDIVKAWSDLDKSLIAEGLISASKKRTTRCL